MTKLLTIFLFGVNLLSLLAHPMVGICNPFTRSENDRALFAVFFRLSFRAVLSRFYSVMAGLFGQLHGWPHLVAVLQTHSNPPPKICNFCASVYPLIQGFTV